MTVLNDLMTVIPRIVILIGFISAALLLVFYGMYTASKAGYRRGVRHGSERAAMNTRHAEEREAEARTAEKRWHDLAQSQLERLNARKLWLPRGAVRWLTWGERENSSNGIFAHLTGIPLMLVGGAPPAPPPLDASDFNRCRMLLGHVPEWRGRLGEMAELGPEWEALVAHWDELCELMDGEDDVRYPLTCRRIWELLDGARATAVVP